MRGSRERAVAGAACLALATFAGSAATSPPAKAAKPAVVEVVDFFFGPSAVTIRKEGKVKWAWAATNVESHDVYLKQGPKNLKKKGTYSTKTTAVTNATFVKAFPTPGSYRYICTIHPTKMKLTVTVKK
ncbi:MAG TPA: plastocyanin/azurin family copper-binding protein [Solirubrobacterales bacterium]